MGLVLLSGVRIISYSNMNSNKKGAKKKVKKQPPPPVQAHQTVFVATDILMGVVEAVQKSIEVVERRRYLEKNLSTFAYIFSLLNFEDFFHRMMAAEQQRVSFEIDGEPKPIPKDNLTFLQVEKSDRFDNTTIVSMKESIRQSRVSSLSKTQSKTIGTLKIKREKAVQLELEPIKESKFIGELRQKKLDSENEVRQKLIKQQEEKKLLERKQALQSLQVSFDYNGEILHRVDRDQNNLIKKVLDLKLKKQKISKKGESPPEAEPIESVKKKGYQKKEREKKVKKSEFTEFLDSQSLAESVDINRGIKYCHNSLLFQERKRTQSIPDLKSRLGKRRMSRLDIEQIKHYTQEKSNQRLKKFKTEQVLQSRLGSKRAFSEANFDVSRRTKGVINVMNPELKRSMLIRLQDYQNFLVLQKEFPEVEQDCMAKEGSDRLSLENSFQNDDALSRLIEPERMTPKLPPISRVSTPPLIDEDQLIISKLNEELRNKMLF